MDTLIIHIYITQRSIWYGKPTTAWDKLLWRLIINLYKTWFIFILHFGFKVRHNYIILSTRKQPGKRRNDTNTTQRLGIYQMNPSCILFEYWKHADLSSKNENNQSKRDRISLLRMLGVSMKTPPLKTWCYLAVFTYYY